MKLDMLVGGKVIKTPLMEDIDLILNVFRKWKSEEYSKERYDWFSSYNK